MNKLYPLKFKPLFREKLWGGQNISKILKMDFRPAKNCGEAWLLSGVEGSQSIVSEGFLKGNDLNELVDVFMEDLVGDHVFENYGAEFPILVKILDSVSWLSLQVHPDDLLAYKRHKTSGKSEMWYIMHAEEHAELICGFGKETDKEGFIRRMKDNTIKEILNFEKVKRGEVYYNPAGRIHAVGPGILLAEIQQTSDITYRLSDWGRIDEKGVSRELQPELALEAIDFNVYPEYKVRYQDKENGTISLVKSRHFNTNLISISKSIRKDYHELDSFVILLCIEGEASLGYDEGHTSLKTGECILIPNDLKVVFITPQPMARILEAYIV